MMHSLCCRQVVSSLFILLVAGTLCSQPPVGPDELPATINMEELSKAVGGPSMVNFQLQNVSARTVFSVLAKQGQVVLDPYETTDLLNTLPAQSISFKNEPFLLALRKLAGQLGLSFEFIERPIMDDSPSGLTLKLQKAADPVFNTAGPTYGNGLFLVIATQSHRNRFESLRLAEDIASQKGSTREVIDIDLVVFADPKLKTLGMLGGWALSGADGWTVRSVDKEGVWGERARDHAAQLEWRFTASKVVASGESIKSVSFTLPAKGPFVVTRSERWELTDLKTSHTKDVQLVQGARQYKLLEVKHIPKSRPSDYGETYQVVFSVEGVGISKGRWSRWPLVHAGDLIMPLRLVDAQGNDYGVKTVGLKKGIEEGIVIAEFNSNLPRVSGKAPTGPAVKVIWTVPTEVRMAQMNMQFKEILVPGAR